MSKATARLRAAAMRRANGFCECGCTRFLGEDAQMDHQAGRARVPQKLSNVWMLTASCHRQKTDSKPDAATWLERYIKHCIRWGYSTEQLRAESRLVFVRTRAGLGVSRSCREHLQDPGASCRCRPPFAGLSPSESTPEISGTRGGR